MRMITGNASTNRLRPPFFAHQQSKKPITSAPILKCAMCIAAFGAKDAVFVIAACQIVVRYQIRRRLEAAAA